jgi:hypothetical protein
VAGGELGEGDLVGVGPAEPFVVRMAGSGWAALAVVGTNSSPMMLQVVARPGPVFTSQW